MTPLELIVIGVLWVLPMYVAHEIGKPKHRMGLLWGLLLGWLGVLIVFMLPPIETR